MSVFGTVTDELRFRFDQGLPPHIPEDSDASIRFALVDSHCLSSRCQNIRIPKEALVGYKAIKANDLSARLQFIASPELEGRETTFAVRKWQPDTSHPNFSVSDSSPLATAAHTSSGSASR